MKTREYLDSVSEDRPFFLWMGFYGPHHPYVPSGRFAHMYDLSEVPDFQRAEGDIEAKPMEYRLYRETPDHKYRGFQTAPDETYRRMKAAYYGMISQLDWQLGLTLETLERRGLAQNTIVTFLSDHGEFTGDHGIPAKAPFLLDCMLRVPWIVCAPGAQRGAVVKDLTESVDLFPTLARLAGCDPPHQVQGRDQSSAILGRGSLSRASRQAVYAEAVDKRAVRTDSWKYIHYPGKDRGELYNLQKDPHELINLWDSDKPTQARMRELYHNVMDATEDFRHPTYQRFEATDSETGERVTHYHTW
jgi:arylsulfatase A-like enzyme